MPEWQLILKPPKTEDLEALPHLPVAAALRGGLGWPHQSQREGNQIHPFLVYPRTKPEWG